MILDDFLPMNCEDLERIGWDSVDFVLVSGDAYVDHPSFGPAVIGRVLLNAGYRVGIIAQPDWNDPDSVRVLGTPNLGFLVTSGNLDSMVNHYYVSKRRRTTDSFSPGGVMGKRPDRAVIVYTNLIRKTYKQLPIILGGIEGSLRRFAHYDYWDDSVRRSILIDSGADLLVYGMGEKQIAEIADYLSGGIEARYIRHIPGTCYVCTAEDVPEGILLPSFSAIMSDVRAYADSVRIEYEEQDPIRGKVLIQDQGDRYVVQNPPVMPLEQKDLDWVFELGYRRAVHPSYEALGGVPAIQEVKLSIISERGCFGSCSFCALALHQGRMVTARSHESILREAEHITEDPDFKGYIHDVGGPTANFRQPSCEQQLKNGVCKNRQCLHPEPCPNLNVDHEDYMALLEKLRHVETVKKVFVRSGIRYDYLMHDPSDAFFYTLCEHHVSGQLKVAPEHIDPVVLDYMGKPSGKLYDQFVKKFEAVNREIGKEQYVVPYLMSSHPGSTLRSAIRLAEYLRDIHYTPEQVQDFYPTPGTLSTCMYYTGLDPRTMKPVYVPKVPKEKAMQRALLQYRNPKNYDLVYEALMLENRQDLIGFGKQALICPKKDAADSSGKRRVARNGGKTHPQNKRAEKKKSHKRRGA